MFLSAVLESQVEAVKCGEKSASGKKIRRKGRREFITPYPSPWLFFQFASLCTVPTILTPGNTLRPLCALHRNNLLENVFRHFILKKSLKETACRIACVAGVWKGRERGFWARGKREGRASRVSLAPKTPFPFPFKRLPRRLWRCRMNQGPVWNTYELHLRSSWKEHQRRLQVKTPRSEDAVLFPKWSHTMQPETSDP